MFYLEDLREQRPGEADVSLCIRTSMYVCEFPGICCVTLTDRASIWIQ